MSLECTRKCWLVTLSFARRVHLARSVAHPTLLDEVIMPNTIWQGHFASLQKECSGKNPTKMSTNVMTMEVQNGSAQAPSGSGLGSMDTHVTHGTHIWRNPNLAKAESFAPLMFFPVHSVHSFLAITAFNVEFECLLRQARENHRCFCITKDKVGWME